MSQPHTQPVSRERLEATTRALIRLSGHWPRAFPWLRDASEHAASMRADYARATVGAPVGVIADAAEFWIAREKYRPQPAEFGAACRALGPATEAGPSGPVVDLPPSLPPEVSAKHGRLDRLYKAGAARLRERGQRRVVRPLAQVWALLVEANPRGPVFDAVRDGAVDEDVFLETVDAWLAGRRPKRHPMNNLDTAPNPGTPEKGAA